MSRPATKDLKLTEAEYLEMELASPMKHEYRAGQLFAMTGASDAHNIIALNLASILRNHLRGSPCRVFMSDMKLKLDADSAYYYPDLMVSCEKAPDSHYREQPVLVVEVLSDSTAKNDAGDKRRAYQKLDSLREYALVAQECMDVRIYRRDESGWNMNIYTDGAVIPFNSVKLEIPIERIYEEAWD
jgi:Uma2 family endonuclease